MANKKITELDLLTDAPAGTDFLAIVDDTIGTPTTKRVTVTNLMGQASASNLSSYDFNGNAISNFDASINDQIGTTYTVQSSDNGKVVVLDNGTGVVVTVDASLGKGFNCSFVQKGAGQVSFTGAVGVTINNRQSHTKINGQYGVASIVAYAADTFVLAGDTAA